ncbi:phosphopantetheine-binding protein [Corynebacterium sp. P5848]|uniref:phosphopantetheine-binding protein n=1 Tax=Corynebacterium marambiense TaxID=2765364 RepID=UPI0022608B8B|nr:phosphopantetheine-binding protein [Corynebacterium marambiense]MCX7541626.1 phosphopantetheine-binding protein [Corynebacterium marambiense]
MMTQPDGHTASRAVLTDVDRIEDAIVAAVPTDRGCDALIAWVTGDRTLPPEANPEWSPGTALQQELLGAGVDRALIPGSIEFVDEIPTSVGEAPPYATTGQFDPPEPGVETELADLIESVCVVVNLGRHDDFFALGCNSIQAISIASRSRATSHPVTARMIFENPTIADLCATEAGEAHVTADEGDGTPGENPPPMSASGLDHESLVALLKNGQQ